jgi:hypothetical protein
MPLSSSLLLHAAEPVKTAAIQSVANDLVIKFKFFITSIDKVLK